MLSCLMVADDFTGACDTGLQFARFGLRTLVCIGIDGGTVRDIDADVLILDTGSRNCDRLTAERLVQTARAAVSGVRVRLFYKKVDSDLRGNLATEIWTTMRGFRLNLCFFAPALPGEGRVTLGGHHRIHGVPVHRTAVGRDVADSYLPRLLRGDSRLRVRLSVCRKRSHSKVVHAVEAFRGENRSRDSEVVRCLVKDASPAAVIQFGRMDNVGDPSRPGCERG